MATQTLFRRLPWPVTAFAFGAGLWLGASRRRPSQRRRLAARDADTQDEKQEAQFGGASAREEPLSTQRARAQEPNHGRHATAPLEIPWRGWKDILWRVYEEIGNDRVMAVAAGVVFYSLLAVFPAITALVSSYGLIADVNTIGGHLQALSDLMPASAFGIVQSEVLRIVAKGGGKLTVAFILGLGLAIWSANAGVKAVFDALNVIYDEKEKRSFITLNLISLAFTLGALMMALLGIGAIVVFPLMLGYFGLNTSNPLLLSLLRWPILLVAIVGALALLYRFGPSRDNPQWRWVSAGSLFAAIAWIAGSSGFSFYLSHFANYDATYGSLGAVIGLMMWMWLSSIVVLIGAELNAEIEHQTARDTTEGQPEPLGTRGATMADTVGAAKT